jgi:GNAT superfamily N-acetyltransferase
MPFTTRPATAADVPELVALQTRWDTHWFGAPEHDEGEVRESFDRVDPLTERSLVLLDDDRLVAAAWWWRPDDATILVDPVADTEAACRDLLPWLADSGAEQAEALGRDVELRSALTRYGWEHVRSQFELLRDPAGLPAPSWPDGVTVSSLGDDADEVYRVIYDEAGWADVPGHGRRDVEEWHSLFVADVDPAQQVLAREDGRLVGVALGKTFSDGTGWVAQLAVPRDQQGRGLGTALLAEAFGRRVAAGATQLGLGVSAANADALRLYQRLGLTIDREWMVHRPRRS